jgi:DNA-binding CsgD family transcriptional regulator
MKTTEINDRDRQMLELLAEGASNRVVADRLGYREGTMRVYLHGLYKKLGVANKTSAVIWYFDRLKEEGKAAGIPSGDGEALAAEESFGDMAWRENPLSALGAMSMFLGAYGRLWEVATRLKGAAPDARMERRRWQSRQLFEALLRGDVAYGKRLYDEDHLARLLVDSPSDAVLLACLLRIGGYTRAAERVHTQLARRRKGRPGLSTKEFALVTALREAFDGGAEGSLAGLYRLASENSSKPFPRHAAMAALYWGYRSLKDRERAVATANALLAEAESVRQQLLAMGERPLYRDATLPQPGAARAKSAAPKAAKPSAARVAVEQD